MALIEGFRVRNYGVLKDVQIGKLWDSGSDVDKLTPLVAVIGKNGTGKSTLFDAFGFLADSLSVGVEEACEMRGRRGYERIVSSGSDGPIKFDVYYRESGNDRPITYGLSIGTGKNNRVVVKEERLRQRRKGQKKYGWPYSFMHLKNGKGEVWKGMSYAEEDSDEESPDKVNVELEDKSLLGIATLGNLTDHPRIAKFSNFISNWYLSYFTPDAARSLPLAGPQKRLNIHGDNLGNVVQFMEREHPRKFNNVLKKITEKIPGINEITTKKTADDRLLLQFNETGFKDPFYAQQMSDGTLKLFAYLILLEDPDPPPFLCIEEPENGLYHKLLETLANEFREHATGLKGSSQIFVTTHQPYFVDALNPEETWILEKGDDGFATIRRASNDPKVNAMVEEGLPLGSLWYSDYLDKR